MARSLGALVGGFEAGAASRRLKHFQPSRSHLNTLIAAVGAQGAGSSSLIADARFKADVQRLWLAWTMTATPRASPTSTASSGARRELLAL